MLKGRGASARSSPVVTPSPRSSGGCSSDVPNVTRGCLITGSHVRLPSWLHRCYKANRYVVSKYQRA